ncbi:MAG TPA: helix-turn-helix domain-containing protein [Caulobacter sp.]|nr:helix-turn-helix domain-containing protein [Caulobacter sp.]
MKRNRLVHHPDPIARSLDLAGDAWTLMILWVAGRGVNRFDDFKSEVRIPASTLAGRLRRLVAEGFFVRRRYRNYPPRYEYLLTDAGLDFQAVLSALSGWAHRNSSTTPPHA